MSKLFVAMHTLKRDSLVLLGCTALLLLVNWAIWVPWAADLDAKQQIVEGMQLDLAEIERQADRLKGLSTREQVGQSLLTQVNALAGQHGVVLESVRPMGEAKVRFNFSAAESQAFWQWLRALETGELMYERLSLSPMGKGTGTLNGQVTLIQMN